jgi:hypothetical protein
MHFQSVGQTHLGKIMNRRLFVGRSILAAAATLPLSSARADLSPSSSEGGTLLSAADLVALQDSTQQFAQSGQLAGAAVLASEAELVAYVRQQYGDYAADYINADFFTLANAAAWAGSCAGASSLATTRITRAGAIALMRYCTGAGWAYMLGWNIGTGLVIIVSSTVSSFFLAKTLDKPNSN